MKRNLLFLVTMLLFCSLVFSEKLAVLEEPLAPNGMAVGSKYIYILEEPTIYVYSKDDFRLVRKFGNAGEGPREFKISTFGMMPMLIFPFEDKLLVNSDSKVSFFTEDGEFIDEFKVPPMQAYLPFGKQFISTGSAKNKKEEQVLTLNLCNSQFKKQKELYQSDMVVGTGVSLNFPLSSFSFRTYKDEIYIVSGKEGFVILVFDSQGNKLREIRKDFKQLKLPETYKKKTLNFYQHSTKMKQFWGFFKDRISFKKYYPAIQEMQVNDQRIYILTYVRKGDETQCIILDLEGKEQGRIYVPLPESYGDIKYLYDIRDRAFYRLVENLDDEVWELHKKKLW